VRRFEEVVSLDQVVVELARHQASGSLVQSSEVGKRLALAAWDAFRIELEQRSKR
jgi:hypothetical protein